MRLSVMIMPLLENLMTIQPALASAARYVGRIHYSLLLVVLHRRLNELSELSVPFALFNVGHLIVLRFLEQAQITLIALFAQFSVLKRRQERAADFRGVSAIGETTPFGEFPNIREALIDSTVGTDIA